MKINELTSFPRESTGDRENQCIEIKDLNKPTSRLARQENNGGKMKGYPEMLLKTNDTQIEIYREPVMFNKNKPLTLGNP
jgi:hypothetical protein